MTKLNSLRDLGTAFVPLPEMSQVFEVDDLKEFEARAERVREAAEEIRTWTLSTLGHLEKVKRMSREAQELTTPQLSQTKEDLANLLEHETPAFRRAAWLGLLEHEFSQEFTSRSAVGGLLDRLVKEGRLVEDSAGSLKAYGQTYAISPDSCFGEPEVEKTKKFFVKLLDRVFQETGKARAKKAEDLRAKGSSDLAALLAGTPGKYAVEVPPERVVQNGNEFWRAGGTLFVSSNGQEVRPIDASGGIQAPIGEARDLGVFLKVYTLSWDRPPVIKGLDPERGAKVQLLWHLLKRALRAKEEAERLTEAKTALARQANLSPKEFFLEGKEGICLAEFAGTWEMPDGSAGPSDLFFLVERKEEGNIRLVDAPDLDDFFVNCDEEYPEEGDKFEGCPQPLRAVLQAVYGQTLKASQNGEKAGQVNG